MEREKELTDETHPDGVQAVTELLLREAQSPSKEDEKPPDITGGFLLRPCKLSLNATVLAKTNHPEVEPMITDHSLPGNGPLYTRITGAGAGRSPPVSPDGRALT
jgi:hypothetical protein